MYCIILYFSAQFPSRKYSILVSETFEKKTFQNIRMLMYATVPIGFQCCFDVTEIKKTNVISSFYLNNYKPSREQP